MATIIKQRGRWRAQVRRVGEKSISKTFSSKAEAVAWARQIEGAMDAGTHRPRAVVTVAEVIQAYRELRERSGRPIADTANEHYQLRLLDAGLGPKRAESLTVGDLVQYAQDRRAEGAGPYTINTDVGRLGTVLRHTAAALELAVPDVVGAARPTLHHLGLIGGGGKRARRPTDDELDRIAEYARQAAHRSVLWAAMPDMIAVAVQTALRRGELLRIRWEDVDVARRLCSCAIAKTRGARTEIISGCRSWGMRWRSSSGSRGGGETRYSRSGSRCCRNTGWRRAGRCRSPICTGTTCAMKRQAG